MNQETNDENPYGIDEKRVALYKKQNVDRYLTRPARVGNTLFQTGTSSMLVIERAQEEYERGVKEGEPPTTNPQSTAHKLLQDARKAIANAGLISMTPADAIRTLSRELRSACKILRTDQREPAAQGKAGTPPDTQSTLPGSHHQRTEADARTGECAPKPDRDVVRNGQPSVHPTQEPAMNERELLREARCPNCDGSGSFARALPCGEVEQVQCQWCFERDDPLSRPAQEPVGELISEEYGIPGGNAMRVTVHFYDVVPPIGTKLYTSPCPPSPWISVRDRLPVFDEQVFVHGGIAYYGFDGIWYTLMEGFPYRPIQWQVTHWMPLPAIPKEGT